MSCLAGLFHDCRLGLGHLSREPNQRQGNGNWTLGLDERRAWQSAQKPIGISFMSGVRRTRASGELHSLHS